MVKPYKVEYLEGGTTDITAFVVSLDKWKKYSDGRISQCTLTLNAEFGQFITTNSGGTTPIIDEFDRIRVTVTDFDGNSQAHIFEMKTDLSQHRKESSYLIPIELEGRERNLAFIPFSGYYEFVDHKTMAIEVLNSYEKNDGTSQPIFTTFEGPTEFNKLPDNNPNIWDFQYIDNCLDALREIVLHANNSVAAGGAGDRFAIIFDDDPSAPLSTIIVRIISQGTTNSPTFPTLQDTLANPIQSIEEIKQPKTGTRVIARGKPGSGTMRANFDKYRSRLEFFLNTQQYDDAKSYVIDNFVRQGAIVYQAILATSGNRPPNATFWKVVPVGDFIGNIQYSPYTIMKEKLFRNACGNPEGALDPLLFTSLKVMDYNLVILDAKTFRDFCYVRSNTDDLTADSFKKKYLFNETNLIDGFRILVDSSIGAIAGAFAADNFGEGAGNDPNGRPYKNSFAILIGTDWFVFRVEHQATAITAFSNPGGGKVTATSNKHGMSNGRTVRIDNTTNYNGTFVISNVTTNTFDFVDTFVATDTGDFSTKDFDECAVISEGRIYEHNVSFVAASRTPGSDDRHRGGTPTGAVAWRDASNQFLGNDCFHAPTLFENTEGLIDPLLQPNFSGSITAFADAGGGLVRATTSVAHGMPVGRSVTISGTVNYNGTHEIKAITATTFDFTDTFVITETGTFATPNETYTKLSGIRIKYAFQKQTETPEYKLLLDKVLGILTIFGSLTTILTAMAAALFNLFATPYYTSAGWWIVFASPHPFSTHNSISEKIGELYGGDINTIQDHHFFDAYNEIFTPSGKPGWNQFDSDDLMEITGVSCLYKLNIRSGGVDIPFTGDIPFAYWIIDNNGTIWKSKEPYRFLGDIQRFTFYFGNFTPVYRARSPFGISNVVENILTPELEIRDVFFKNKIIYQGFQLEMSYDEHGRYTPNLIETVVKPTVFNVFGFTGSSISLEFDGVIDAWHWIKSPIALSLSDADSALRTIYPDIKDFQNITNIEQLQRAADAQLDIEKFRYEQYTVENYDRADRKLQDTIFLKDEFLIAESDDVANTRKVVVSEIMYEVPKNEDLKRTMIVNRRIPKK